MLKLIAFLGLLALSNAESCNNDGVTYAEGSITFETSSFADLGLTDDEIADKVLAMFEAGTCPSGTAEKQSCGTGKCDTDTTRTEAYYYEKEVTYDGESYRLVVSNGMPDHCSAVDAVKQNPNMACEHFYGMLVPANPEITDTMTEWGMGGIGIMTTGALVYNHKSAEDECNAAAISEADTLDSCLGHSDAKCHYHYHSAPECAKGWQACKLMGYMRDGVPIYGQCSLYFDSDSATLVEMSSSYSQIDGTSGCDTSHYTYTTGAGMLDDANGYLFTEGATSKNGRVSFDAGSYVYFYTSTYPFSQVGYKGVRYNKRGNAQTPRGICEFTMDDMA